MNRLQLEWHRLYLPPAAAEVGVADLVDAGGRVRAMVLELARPADWPAISKVWHGVQADLDLPAPAIAVSGVDGYQLWFSLQEPVPAPQARAFLEALRVHYLGHVEADRLTLMPAPADTALPLAVHAPPVPAPCAASGHWSAFVAPDLAPMFASEPWLDVPPNEDGQARLLSRLASIEPADLQRAMARLRPAAAPPQAPLPLQAPVSLDPAEFLRGVLNDDTLPLALRIEAAKALLQSAGNTGR
jgi:hypothetical protein